MVADNHKEYYGKHSNLTLDGSAYTMSSPYQLTNTASRVLHVEATSTTTAFLRLPDATTMSAGGFVFILRNGNATISHNVKISDYDGTYLFLLLSSHATMSDCTICLVDASTTAGVWACYRMDGNTMTRATGSA